MGKDNVSNNFENNMKKKFHLGNSFKILVTISILFIISIIIYFTLFNGEKNISSSDSINLPDDIQAVRLAPTDQEKALEYCNKLSIEDRKDCYNEIAYFAEEIEICEKMEEGIDNSVNVGDKDWKSIHKNTRVDNCKATIAIKNKDFSLCDELDSFSKNKCYTKISVILQDDSYCDQLIGIDRDKCFQQTAISLGNVNICSKISDSLLYNYCISEIAKKLKDVEICETLSYKDSCILDSITKENYYEGICDTFEEGNVNHCLVKKATITKDKNVCIPLKDNFVYGGDCFTRLAEELNDSSICENISFNESKNTCYYYVAISSQNVETCFNIESSSEKYSKKLKSDCIFQISVKKDDENLCEMILLEEYASWCNAYFFAKNKEIDKCDTIKSNKNRNWCIHLTAAELKDDTLCLKIKNNEEQNDCFLHKFKLSIGNENIYYETNNAWYK